MALVLEDDNVGLCSRGRPDSYLDAHQLSSKSDLVSLS